MGFKTGRGGDREDAGKAYRFKIESNQINLQASLVMEKYAKFQLGKTRCEAATLLLCFHECALTVSLFLYLSTPAGALINLNFQRQ